MAWGRGRMQITGRSWVICLLEVGGSIHEFTAWFEAGFCMACACLALWCLLVEVILAYSSGWV